MGSQKSLRVKFNKFLTLRSTRPQTAKIARFSLSCCFYTSQTVTENYFRYPRVVTRSRNHFTAVPQASTPSHCGVFRVFFTHFLTFRTFSLEILTFSPKRGNGNACPLFFPAPSGFKATFVIILAGLRWLYGALMLQPRKTLKNTKFRCFLENLCFLRSKAFHRVSLHRQKV